LTITAVGRGRRNRWRRVLTAFVLVAVLAVVGAEIAARWLIRQPLYQADNVQGYWIAPNQTGRFMGRYNFAFNALGMATDRPFRPTRERRDILLVGDSVVVGANDIDHDERLAALLSRNLGDATLWPIGAKSWALQNQLQWLRAHRSVVNGVDRIVLVLNPQDFADPSFWSNEFTHPRTPPRPALLYMARKALGIVPPDVHQAKYIVPRASDLAGEWRRFIEGAGRPVDVVVYPDLANRRGACGYVPRALYSVGRWHCLTQGGEWPADSYLDDIHPNLDGRRRLAARLAAIIDR
jgi:hypothetical protein